MSLGFNGDSYLTEHCEAKGQSTANVFSPSPGNSTCSNIVSSKGQTLSEYSLSVFITKGPLRDFC